MPSYDQCATIDSILERLQRKLDVLVIVEVDDTGVAIKADRDDEVVTLAIDGSFDVALRNAWEFVESVEQAASAQATADRLFSDAETE